MQHHQPPGALIAEDEPLLAQALQAELARAWPQLEVLATAGDGISAARLALQLRPQVLFFDVQMPGQDGLAAAAEIADGWPYAEAPLPQLVFVSAYDAYAVRAFEAHALDYVLKPVQPERLQRSVARLRQALAHSANAAPAGTSAGAEPFSPALQQQTLAHWQRLLAAAGAALPRVTAPPAAQGEETAAPLKFITASDTGGATVRLVPIDDVLYFEAADKYVRVLTDRQEHLIRTPLRQLLGQLDPAVFWQVHRAIVVRASAIETARRDALGKLHLSLHGRPQETIPVSRMYAHLFKAM